MNQQSPLRPTRRAIPVTHSKATTGLFVIALFFALYLARQILLPVVLALLFGLLLAPVVRGLQQLKVPTAVAAAVVVFTLLGMTGTGAYLLAEPASTWLEKAPHLIQRLEARLSPIRQRVEEVSETAEEVGELGDGRQAAPRVVIETPGFRRAVFANIPIFAAGVVIWIFMLFFILATRDLFMAKLRKILPTREDKRHAVEIAQAMEVEVSRYLFTAAMINFGLGVVVAMLMALLGMPNPLLWGALAGLLNFIPYLGPAVAAVVIGAVALLSFENVGYALLVPGLFMLLTSLEGQLVTPLIMGRRLQLNPLVVFLSVVFWGWLWGIFGALMAVPIVVSLKIIFDRTPSLAPVGELLGR